MPRRAYIPNGYARRHGCRPGDFDATQLRRGTKVEMEHTRDSKIAQQIALDHLCEDRDYYKKLAKVHLDGRRQFGAASCSTSPRWVRGGVGFLIGGMLGGMIGGGLALAVATSKLETTTATTDAVKRVRNMALIASGVSVLGAVGGLAVGAWKPEC
jgi:uncharacterized protein DUF5661